MEEYPMESMRNDTTKQRLVELRDEITSQLQEAKSKVETLEYQLDAINTTLALLDAPLSSRLEFSDQSKRFIVPGNLSGMTQAKALAALAKSNGGKVRLVDAHKVFREFGLMKETKNWYNILFNVVTKSDKFERCGPGEYRLIEKEADGGSVLKFGTS
jgi:hypothetical protein